MKKYVDILDLALPYLYGPKFPGLDLGGNFRILEYSPRLMTSHLGIPWYVGNMKEYVGNIEEYVKNMKEYVKNMKKYVENMKWHLHRESDFSAPPLYGPWDLEKFHAGASS